MERAVDGAHPKQRPKASRSHAPACLDGFGGGVALLQHQQGDKEELDVDEEAEGQQQEQQGNLNEGENQVCQRNADDPSRGKASAPALDRHERGAEEQDGREGHERQGVEHEGHQFFGICHQRLVEFDNEFLHPIQVVLLKGGDNVFERLADGRRFGLGQLPGAELEYH
ncbi:MAG: hypothetical protein DRQ89_14585 [Epsilonproteobacteria bacterium]|nr:MAG: hypothetical protein DRQ89_14585 [Campylobacterota bacterium]